MNELINELKVKIVETLNLADILDDEINEDAQLVGGELGIDSIDILELAMMIQRDYSIKIDNDDKGREIFLSIRSLADFIHENLPEKKI